jgi:uncharacterized membrane protein YfcA
LSERIHLHLSTSSAFLLLSIGLAIGIISGMVGIGGGVLVIPLLMFFFGFSQARANGTSLAMLLPPIGIFAVMSYWNAGNVDWRFALLLAFGFAVGAYIGAAVVNRGWINPTALRVGFALLLVYSAARLLFRQGGHARAALETSLMVAAFAVTYLTMRLLGRHWRQSPDWGKVYRAKRDDSVGYDYEI